MMTGIALARAYFEDFGKEMLASFPSTLVDRVAVGLVGEGSECFGFDDIYSQDHDFGAGFCLWLSENDFSLWGGTLSEKYEALPQNYQGFSKRSTHSAGKQRIGVWSITDFYQSLLGQRFLPQSTEQWRSIKEEFYALAVNGAVFMDNLGLFTSVRNTLLGYFPQDVWMKKLAGHLAVMAQAGQYNYPRARKRSYNVVAALTASKFIEAAISAAYVANRCYAPYYKWAQPGLRNLPKLSELADLLELVVSGSPGVEVAIEAVCALIGNEFYDQGILSSKHRFLMDAACEVTLQIKDKDIRQENIFNT